MQDLNDKVTGGTLTADEWNEVPSEIQNVITNAGITLSGADLSQLLKAISSISRTSNFGVDSGVADAYVVTLSNPATQYTTGMIVTFDAANVNTSASTINVDGLGVKQIFAEYISTEPLVAGSISGLMTVIYNGTNFGLYSDSMVVPYDRFISSLNLLQNAVVNLIKSSSVGVQVGNEINLLEILAATTLQLRMGATKKLAINCSENTSVELYYNGTQQALKTVDRTSSSQLSGAAVLDSGGTQQNVGFNKLPLINSDVSLTLLREHSGKLIDFEGVAAQTYTLDINANLPNGWTVMIQNRGTSTLAIAQNVSGTTQFMDGSGSLSSGARTLAIAGICTITKLASDEYVIFGNGLS